MGELTELVIRHELQHTETMLQAMALAGVALVVWAGRRRWALVVAGLAGATAVVMGTSPTALQGGIAGTVGGIGGAGGPIGRATGGLAGTITGALLPVLGAVGGSEGTGGP